MSKKKTFGRVLARKATREAAKIGKGIAREGGRIIAGTVKVFLAHSARSTRRVRKEEAMQLLTEELRKILPPLYSQEGNDDPTVHIKFFTPDSNWTWFVTEGSEEDGEFRFFGFVQGQEQEWGYFNLSELQTARGPHGLEIERDLYFKPVPFSQLNIR